MSRRRSSPRVLLVMHFGSLDQVKSRAMLKSSCPIWVPQSSLPFVIWEQLLSTFSPDMPSYVTYLLVMTALTPKSLTVSSTNRTVKAVLLVGGFGESPYLRESLRAAVGPGIEILVPTNRWALSSFPVTVFWLIDVYSWTAVVRGALMKGLARNNPSAEQVKVETRLARKHYGSECGRKYDRKIHAHSKKWFDPSWGATAS